MSISLHYIVFLYGIYEYLQVFTRIYTMYIKVVVDVIIISIFAMVFWGHIGRLAAVMHSGLLLGFSVQSIHAYLH